MLEFKLPSLGADMDEGTVIEWKVQPGDVVKKGDVLAVVDTTKAAIDVETWVEGTVHALVAEPGQTVPVGGVLATLLAPGEEPPSIVDRLPSTVDRLPSTVGTVAVEAAPGLAEAPAPETRGPAEVLAKTERRRVSPAARRRATELGVDLASMTATGPDGSVTLEDVERHATLVPGAGPAPAAARHVGTIPAVTRDRRADMRRTIGAAMARAKREIPHYYLAETVPLGAATAWLTACNAGRPVTERMLMSALLLKAVARAARKYPDLNGAYTDERFAPAEHVHVGVAISLRGGGLVAPAIRDCDRLPAAQLMRALADLVQRARAGSLRSSELADATITVTNIGDQGVADVYGVIYPPQVALVGFGRIADEVVAADGAIRVMPVVHASLSADHRVSDGHRGALFLAHIRDLLQQPAALAEDVP